VSERRLAYLARFAAEPPAYVRRKKRRRTFKPRPARLAGNALLSRLL
jgi:hypothetical protein